VTEVTLRVICDWKTLPDDIFNGEVWWHISKVLHIVEMTWNFFVVNKRTWIDCMKEWQVSGILSGKWCGHLAWRER